MIGSLALIVRRETLPPVVSDMHVHTHAYTHTHSHSHTHPNVITVCVFTCMLIFCITVLILRGMDALSDENSVSKNGICIFLGLHEPYMVGRGSSLLETKELF